MYTEVGEHYCCATKTDDGAQVYHEFGGPGAENAQDIETADGRIYRIGIYFTGIGCQTVWTYEWKNIAGE